MTGERLGAYAIETELGSGGMGTVHLAEVAEPVAGLQLGDKVALKVIHPHLLGSPGFFKRFLREAELGRKVQHDNVVRTFEVDASERGDRIVHYLVMEYVEGKNLRQLLDDLGRVPETLLREIGMQAAAGLSAIHERGIIHRDLKPENILITNQHRVRIMDLGVAKLQQASLAISHAGQFAGSVLYAAPEQFSAGSVGYAADLYSLGVVLYELGAGANPFRRESVEAVIEAQLHHRPLPLTDVATDTSHLFAELVATLLEKEDSRRFESAGHLRDVLGAGERSDWWQERERRLRASRHPVPEIAVRRETQLHGRQRELRVLREAWDRALGGEGSTVLIEGEAGIGKTRLVDVFLKEAAASSDLLLYGSYSPSGGLGGISQALLSRFGGTHLASALRPHLGEAGRLAASFAAVLKHEAIPPGDALIRREAMHSLFSGLVRSLSVQSPLLWVVDDLHFAEPESRQVVLNLARAATGHAALIIVTTRPVPLEEELAHLSRLPGFRRIVPGRLSERDVIELLAGALHSRSLAERLGGKIAFKSDGVPYFVFEMIRGLKEAHFLRELSDGSYVETSAIEQIEIPDAVRDLIEARLLKLSKEERAILDLGAVQGFEFDADLLAMALGRRRVAVLQDLAEIERRHGVVRSEGSRTRFDHHQIQEVLYEELIPGLRSEYHSLLATAFGERERSRGRKPEEARGELASLLAHHALNGTAPADGLPWLHEALAHCKGAYRNQAAVELLGRALAIDGGVETEARIDLLLRQAEFLDLLGRREPGCAVLAEALALARSLDSLPLIARTLISLGGCQIHTARYADAEASLIEARRVACEAREIKLEIHATRTLGQVYLPQGRCADARRLFDRCLGLAREIGDRFEEAAALGSLGSAYTSLNRVDKSRACLEEALALAREIGERNFEMAAIGNLGNLAGWEGRYDEARERIGIALDMAREMGDRTREASATLNLGVMAYSQGRYDEAEADYERHLGLVRGIGNRRGEALCEGNLAGLAGAQGRYADALGHLDRQVGLAREIGDREVEGLGLVCLGSLRVALGVMDEAEETSREALKLCRKIEYRYGEGYALTSLAAIADSRGESDEARRLIEEAIVVRRETGQRHGLAEALLHLGEHLAHRGVFDEARARLEEARELAIELDAPQCHVAASAWLAVLPGGDLEGARAALAENRDRIELSGRVEALHLFWKAAKDPADLEQAYRLLQELRQNCPAEYRPTVIDGIPHHREIVEAYEQCGSPKD